MDKMSLIRTIVLLLGLINMILTSFGKSPLPFTDDQVNTDVTVIWTVAASLWTWWNHTFIGKNRLQQQQVLQNNGLNK